MRKLVLVLIVVVILGAVAFATLPVGPAPAIAIEPAAKVIGRNTPVVVKVSEPSRGVSTVKVELVQGESVQTLAEQRNVPAPSWAPWRSGTPATELKVQVGKDALPSLQPGNAVVRVSAARAGALLWSPAPAVAQIELPVRMIPPTVQVLSTFTYVNQGGAEVVVYRVGEGATRDGVRAGDRFFPGFALPGGGAQDRFALFAVPYDMNDPANVRLVVADAAGNEAQVRFIDKFFPKPTGSDTIKLNDTFMQKVTNEIMSQLPELQDKGNLLDNYLQINRDLRKKNDAFLVDLAAMSQQAFLWHSTFLPMLNTAIKANFAERRSYLYHDQKVDQQSHLGLDMASVHADPVPAANDGVVAFAGYLGIYGNCVVLDHGYGLQTLYGHLSSLEVKRGDKVGRGQTIGKSGASGLAGGDHLHFAVLLQGLPISPIEWFDKKWMNDRLKLKLKAALPYPGA
jgi:murein DD-endopeptidase MepM/ murein hydrolase activator NlpD